MRFASYCTVVLLLLSTAAATSQTAGADEAVFRVFFRGQPIGSETIRVTRSDDGLVIEATGRLDAPINLTTRRFEASYDASGRPRELIVEASLQGQDVRFHTTIEGGTAATELLEGDRVLEATDDMPDDAILLPNNFFAAYEALAARLGTSQPEAGIPIFTGPGTPVMARLESVEAERITTSARTLMTRRHRIVFENPTGSLVAYVWSDETQANRLVRVSLPALGIEVARDDILAITSRTELISHPGDEQARIAATGFSLAATISKPPGRIAGRLPGLVLVPGAQPLDRDEAVHSIPIFGQIAGLLADAGFVVVRYDKRGIGQSGGRAETVTLADYAEDVRAVVRYLGSRSDVDPNRIVVLGRGEGGWMALLAAAAERRIAAAVLVSTPGTTGAGYVLERQRRALERSTLSAGERQARIELQERIHAAVTGKESWDNIPDDVRRQADTPYFRSLLTFSPEREIRRVRQPVLIVRPEFDDELAAHHADRLLELAAARGANRVADIAHLSGAGHLLTPTAGDRAGGLSLDRATVTPAIAPLITEWLQRTLSWRFPGR